MIEHLVLFKFSTIPDDVLASFYSLTNEFINVIPGVKEVSFGKNFSERSQGFNFALRVLFENKEALNNYTPHSKHQEFVKAILPYKEDILCVDFERNI